MIFASSVSSVAKCLSESNASAEAGASLAEALLWWSPFGTFGDFFRAGVEVEKLKLGTNASGMLENCQYPFFWEQQLV